MTSEDYDQKIDKLFEAFEIPREFQAPLSYYAYERGHSGGFEECFIYLVDVVSMVSKPIKEYTNRLTLAR